MMTHYEQIKREIVSNFSNYGFTVCDRIILDEYRRGYITNRQAQRLIEILDELLDRYGTA